MIPRLRMTAFDLTTALSELEHYERRFLCTIDAFYLPDIHYLKSDAPVSNSSRFVLTCSLAKGACDTKGKQQIA